MTGASRLDLPALFAAMEDAAPFAAVDVLAESLSAALGASGVSFLIADFSGHALVRLDRDGERVPLSDGAHGRALAEQSVQLVSEGGGTLVLAPVTNRGEAIGILEVRFDGVPDDSVVADAATAGHVFAYVVIANRRFTDIFEWGQRSVSLSLAAEIQHRLLPGSYTCEAGQFTLAGWLEPAGEVGGDTFDFTLERDVLHLSMTDAMGHDVDAAVLATVLVGALRNARRDGAGLADQACRANTELSAHARDGGFVTGQVVRVDLRNGTAMIVNAGHPPPLRLRSGRVDAPPRGRPGPDSAHPRRNGRRAQRRRHRPVPGLARRSEARAQHRLGRERIDGRRRGLRILWDPGSRSNSRLNTHVHNAGPVHRADLPPRHPQ
jgi:hypothetical protein